MISVYKLKPQFQALLRPLLKQLRNLGITPNTLTISGLILSLAMGAFSLYGDRNLALLFMPFVLLLRMALNALDGMMARIYQMQSKLGAALNELCDILSDIFMFYPLGVLFNVHQETIFIFIILSLLNEFAGLLGQALNGERRYDGPMGKSDRALVVGLLSMLIYFKIPMFKAFTWIWLTIFTLLIWSTIRRIKNAIPKDHE